MTIHEVAENTLVVFLGDNGCAGYFSGLCSCEPLSGGKLTYYEGGVRVPYLMRSTKAIAAGTRIDTPVSTLDILPTAIVAAGRPVPADLALDGHNLLPLFAGGSVQHDRFVMGSSAAGDLLDLQHRADRVRELKARSPLPCYSTQGNTWVRPSDRGKVPAGLSHSSNRPVSSWVTFM